MERINPYRILFIVAVNIIIVLLFIPIPAPEPEECPKFEIQYDKRPGRAIV